MLENVILFTTFSFLATLDVIISSAVSELQRTMLATSPQFLWDGLLTSFSRLSNAKLSLATSCPTGASFSPFLSRVERKYLVS